MNNVIKRTGLLLCGCIAMGLLASCDNTEMQEFPTEELTDSVKTRSLTDEIPTPMEWAEGHAGTNIHQPTAPDYFEILVNEHQGEGDGYFFMAYFEWNANAFGPHIQASYDDYYLQVQYTTGDPYSLTTHWNNILMPNGHGLVEVIGERTFAPIPAYAFPYGSGDLYIRLRMIDKDFLTSQPNIDGEDLYDRSMFSPWNSDPSDGYVVYHNQHGHDRPQPGLPGDGAPEIGLGDLYVKVKFPEYMLTNWDFSYEIVNHNAGYREVHQNEGTNSKGEAGSMLYHIGKKGGTVTISAKCTEKNDPYPEVKDASRTIAYDFYTTSLTVEFTELDFQD